MPPLTLEGNTLGEKHRNFNRLVQDAVSDEKFELTKINSSDGDVVNLLKIDTACRTRNVSYILEVLKGDDMLYISRAIKQSTWLINELEFAHIINPEYLFTNLFPHMLVKAINKLLLHIRLNLKDENRVEAFYNYLANQETNEYERWLVNCSLPFIENVIQKRRNISLYQFTRLCRRSVIFLKYYTKIGQWGVLKAVAFLVKSDTEEFLNVIDAADEYLFDKLGQKHTEVIMKKCPHRILDRFDRYMNYVDLSIVAKYMKKEDIKDFLLSQSKNPNLIGIFSQYENLKHFINAMPVEERYQFVKTMYIDKNPPILPRIKKTGDWWGEDSIFPSDSIHSHHDSKSMPPCSIDPYIWYQYAPFNEAFTELKKLVRAESSPADRCNILSFLPTCAKGNPENIKTVLQYFYDKHRNEPFKFKIHFIVSVIQQTDTHNFDVATWNILDKLFHTAEVYIESENNVQTCLKCIVVYKVLHDELVPEIVEKKMIFHTYRSIQHKLNTEQKNKLFSYLLSSITTKIKNNPITNESSFDKCIGLLIDALYLLKYWKKDLGDYSFILNKIQELTKLKNENFWCMDLGSLYNVSKSWRRYMFEESLILRPSEGVCLNALKHDPQLLTRYSDKVAVMRTDDKISLYRLLAKLRVYWQHTLAQEWTDAYLNSMNNSTGHKAIVTGLMVLLPRDEVRSIAKKYTPKEAKVDWGEIDQIELSLRKYIAKNLHIARPLPSLEVVLWYAKGDYLQYAVPSLTSIIYNISKVQSRAHMSALLDAPVSLQKYGLNLAFNKLKYDELKSIFADIWKVTKNSTIRTHLFSHTYNLLCTLKEPALLKEVWELMSMFMDNLSVDENKIIYSKLGKPQDVHVSVRGQFFMKSFNILSSLPPEANCENHINSLISYAPDIVDLLDDDFIENDLLAPAKEQLTESKFKYAEIISSYILQGKTEDEQCRRFRVVLIPVLEYAFTKWNTVLDSDFIIRIHIDALTRAMTRGIRKYLPLKKIIVPVKLFMEIEKFIAEKLSIEDDYERCTCWKLTTEYVKLLGEHGHMFSDRNLAKLSYAYRYLPKEAEHVWEEVHLQISPKFGPFITKLLQADTRKYFPTICLLFSSAVSRTFSNLSFTESAMKMDTLKHMIMKTDFIPSYIVVIQTLPGVRHGHDIEKKKFREIADILSSHPSLDVKMHYQQAFGNLTFLLK